MSNLAADATLKARVTLTVDALGLNAVIKDDIALARGGVSAQARYIRLT